MNTGAQPTSRSGAGTPRRRRWSGRRLPLLLAALLVPALAMTFAMLQPRPESQAATDKTYSVEVKAPGMWNCIEWQYLDNLQIGRKVILPAVSGGEIKFIGSLLQATPGEKINFLLMDGGASHKDGCTGRRIYYPDNPLTVPLDNTKTWSINATHTAA
jgi:hypothetical protein